MKQTHIFAGSTLAFILLASAPMAFAETAVQGEADAGVTVGTAPATTGTVKSPRDSASGQATGKRQHQPVIIRKELDKKDGMRNMASTTKVEMRDKMMENREKASTTRGEMKQKAEDRRGEIEQKKKEFQSDMQNRMKEIMKKQGERVIKRLEAALERLGNIAGRIDSRITKQNEQGADTAKAKADLVIAQAKIDAAKAKLDAAKIAIAGILAETGTVATTTPGTIMSGKILLIKEQVRIVETALKEAHKALVLTITDLKGKKGGAATTTATVDD
jgi:hypothetical protein